MTANDTDTLIDVLARLDWLAVVVAALAYFLLGALWFTPLFGRAWDRAIGHTRQRGDRFPPEYYVVPLVSSALVTFAMAVVLTAASADRLADALGLGVTVGFGVALSVSVNNALTPHTPHPLQHGLITGGYHLVGIAGVSLILSWLGR